MGVALLTSLALALTWTPTLSHYFIARSRKREAPSDDEHETVLGARSMRVYERALRFTLEHPLVLAVLRAGADRRIVTSATAHSAPTCCRRWTKAASSSTT